MNLVRKMIFKMEVTLFSLTALRLGLPSSIFLMTLMISLYLINTGILGIIGLKKLSVARAPHCWLSYLQLAPDGADRTSALKSPTGAFLVHF
jgi:hypothetical protein